MNYGVYKKYDIANGDGIRASLFVSGCTHKCQGCFNKEAWDENFGLEFTQKIEQQIIEDLKDPKIAGLSLLGGEPYQHTKTLVPFVKKCREAAPNKNIWSWSGYTFEEILNDANRRELLELVDILVDGRFMIDQAVPGLALRGSKNQRIIDVKRSLAEGKVVQIFRD